MFAEKVIRWSGLALAIGGIIAALFWILHPEESVLLTNPTSYQTEHVLDVVGLMLLIPGLIGLYARLVNRTGWLGSSLLNRPQNLQGSMAAPSEQMA